VLHAAQQQPHLAADLISKTVQSLAQAPSLRSPAEVIVQASDGVSGTQINIKA
jgi:hypothetical protein